MDSGQGRLMLFDEDDGDNGKDLLEESVADSETNSITDKMDSNEIFGNSKSDFSFGGSRSGQDILLHSSRDFFNNSITEGDFGSFDCVHELNNKGSFSESGEFVLNNVLGGSPSDQRLSGRKSFTETPREQPQATALPPAAHVPAPEPVRPPSRQHHHRDIDFNYGQHHQNTTPFQSEQQFHPSTDGGQFQMQPNQVSNSYQQQDQHSMQRGEPLGAFEQRQVADVSAEDVRQRQMQFTSAVPSQQPLVHQQQFRRDDMQHFQQQQLSQRQLSQRQLGQMQLGQQQIVQPQMVQQHMGQPQMGPQQQGGGLNQTNMQNSVNMQHHQFPFNGTKGTQSEFDVLPHQLHSMGGSTHSHHTTGLSNSIHGTSYQSADGPHIGAGRNMARQHQSFSNMPDAMYGSMVTTNPTMPCLQGNVSIAAERQSPKTLFGGGYDGNSSSASLAAVSSQNVTDAMSEAMEKLSDSMRRTAMSRSMVKQFSARSLLNKQGSMNLKAKQRSGRALGSQLSEKNLMGDHSSHGRGKNAVRRSSSMVKHQLQHPGRSRSVRHLDPQQSLNQSSHSITLNLDGRNLGGI